MFGDLQADANFCLAVSDRVGILVVDVDYRMAPGKLRHPWVLKDQHPPVHVSCPNMET